MLLPKLSATPRRCVSLQLPAYSRHAWNFKFRVHVAARRTTPLTKGLRQDIPIMRTRGLEDACLVAVAISSPRGRKREERERDCSLPLKHREGPSRAIASSRLCQRGNSITARPTLSCPLFLVHRGKHKTSRSTLDFLYSSANLGDAARYKEQTLGLKRVFLSLSSPSFSNLSRVEFNSALVDILRFLRTGCHGCPLRASRVARVTRW